MAIKIIIGNKVTFKVEGSFNDEAGKKQPFNFQLTCIRKTVDELQGYDGDYLSEKGAVTNFLVEVVEGWNGVLHEDGTPCDFSKADLRQLLQTPSLAGLVFATYMQECGVKAKN